ncbi:MAG: hypothetical protein HY674_03725, partial [Chloroflexi bacterium]|nr:hypothetical protein [Chloroflexota bacterium]
LDWNDGEGGLKSFTFAIVDDQVPELDEVFLVQLVNPTGGASVSTSRRVMPVVIISDDQPAGAADKDFNPVTPLNPTPGANGTVSGVLVYTNGPNLGKALIGGDFTAVNAVVRRSIARLNADGSVDASFNPGTGADGFVGAIGLQADGKVVIGGGFTSVNNVNRSRIARLNADGTLDSAFSPGSGANGSVHALAIEPGGRIIIAGDFTSYNAVAQNRVARLNANGSLDTSFAAGTGANGVVNALAVQPVLPLLTNADSTSGPGEHRRTINTGATSGTVTVTYNFFGDTNTLRIYYGTTMIYDSGFLNNEVVVTNTDGTLSTNYPSRNVTVPYGPGTRSDVTIVINEGSLADNPLWNYQASIQPSGTRSVLLAGDFTAINGVPRRRLARLTASGALDLNFDPGTGADSTVSSLAVQSDGKIVIGGDFGVIRGVARRGIARLNEDGTLDATFNPDAGFNGPVYVVLGQPDGSTFVGGQFTLCNGTARTNLARLFPDGTLDTGFLDNYYNQLQPGADQFVTSLAVLGNRVLIGGGFARVGGGVSSADVLPRFRIAQLFGGATPGPGNLEFDVLNYSVDENVLGGLVTITVRRVNGVLGAAAVDYATADETAVAGLHYTETKGTLLWTNCDSSIRTFAVPILDNSAVEGDKTFKVTLANPRGLGLYVTNSPALGFRSAASVLIVEDDFNHGTLSFSAPAYTINENDGSATITVTRSGGDNGAVSVDYATEDGTALDGADYTGRTGTLSFLSGQTSKTFTIPIREDTAIEPDETVQLRLFNPAGGAVLGAPATTQLEIIDNDFAAGRVRFSGANFDVAENGGTAAISVRRAGGNAGVLSVQYATSDGTALLPFDYLETAGVLNWNDGDSSTKVFTVQINNDGLVEGDETIGLALFNPSISGALGNVTNATLTIVDDDFYGEVAFNSAEYLADENGGSVTLIVTRRGGSAESVWVSYATTLQGTAIPGVDYQEVNGTLFFDVGETSRSFTVPLVDDAESDRNKTIILSLFDPVFATLGAVTNATLTILDNELANRPAGGLDADFDMGEGPNKPVYAVAVQSDGKLVISGDFTEFSREVRKGITRLTAAGALDRSFDVGTGANGSIRAMTLQKDGRILIGGTFTSVNNAPLNNIARLGGSGSLDATFNPGSGPDNPVYALAETFVGSEARILAGGGFNTFNGFSRHNVVRLGADASVDFAFDPGSGANGAVSAISVLRSGKILIGGDFTLINGISRQHIARLNADGSLDGAFDAGLGTDGSVRALAVQEDDKVVIGGLFTSVGGVDRNYVARLNHDGTLDASFHPGLGANGAVFALALQLDGKLVLGGDFTAFNGLERNRIVRLNPDGSIDPTINFGTGANGFVSAIALQKDRKIVIGGGFTSFDGEPRNYLARLHGGSIAGAGSLEFTAPAFTISETATNAVFTVRRTGGTMGTVTVQFASRADSADPAVDYLDVSGTLTFLPGETSHTIEVPIFDDNFPESDEVVNLSLSDPTGGAALGRQPVTALIIVSDDSVLNFGEPAYSANENAPGARATITVHREGGSSGTVTVRYATSNGTALSGSDYSAVSGTLTFGPGVTNQTFIVPITDDTSVEGNETVNLRLSSPTGGGVLGQASAVLSIIDNDFAPGVLSFTGSVVVNEGGALAVLTVTRTSGKTGIVSVDYATGGGTATAGQDYTGLSGTLTFVDGETVKTLLIRIMDDAAVEGNETISVSLSNPKGGAVLGSPNSVTVTVVDDDFGPGSLDQSFDPAGGPNGTVRALVLQSDGKILIGGEFDTVNGISLNHIGRLNPDGEVDSSFAPGAGPDALVSSLAARAEGKVIAGGAFRTVGTLGRSWVARFLTNGFVDGTFSLTAGENAEVLAVAAQPDGKVLVGGAFTTPSSGIARINANGSLDVSFDPDTGTDGPVRALALQPDGRVIIAGQFTKLGGVPRGSIARLQANGLLDTTFASGLGANGPVNSIVGQSDGKVLIAGEFTMVNGVSRTRVARLNPDGTTDSSFLPGAGPNGAVQALALQADGKVFVAGDFTTVSGVARARIARLLADGLPDIGFNPGRGPDNTVYAVAVQPDGNVLIGGAFTTVNGFSRSRIARLNGDPDAGSTELRVLDAVQLPDGRVRLTFSSQTGRDYLIEASGDLATWESAGTVTAAGTTAEFTDTAAPSFNQRFYRIRRLGS